MTTYTWTGATNDFTLASNWSPSTGVPSLAADDAGMLGAGALPILSGGTRSFDDLTVYRAGFAFEQARGAWYQSEALRPKIGCA